MANKMPETVAIVDNNTGKNYELSKEAFKILLGYAEVNLRHLDSLHVLNKDGIEALLHCSRILNTLDIK